MVDEQDIFRVAVDDEMIRQGMVYAEKSLHFTFNRMALASHYSRLQNIVKGLVMELAFRKLLEFHRVEFDLLGHTHWTKKDRYDVGIGGVRYDVKGSRGPSDDSVIDGDLAWLLDCCALVPTDQLASKTMQDHDHYVFAFMTGRFTREVSELYETEPTLNGPIYLLHSFWDYTWVKNEKWKPKGRLSLKAKLKRPITIRIGGQDKDGELKATQTQIESGEPVIIDTDYYTILFLQTSNLPEGDIGVDMIEHGVHETIGPRDWGNLWPYGSAVYLAGHLAKEEFRRHSAQIPRFYKDCKQYPETRVQNQRMNVRDLESIRSLLPANPTMKI